MSLVPSRDASPQNPGVKLTYDDFVLFPDDGKRHELIDGEHYVSPSPNSKHRAVVLSLGSILWGLLETHPVGRVFVAGRARSGRQSRFPERAAELALERDEILTTPVTPGLELPLARIFADSDFDA